jgi:hypothetical protein
MIYKTFHAEFSDAPTVIIGPRCLLSLQHTVKFLPKQDE